MNLEIKVYVNVDEVDEIKVEEIVSRFSDLLVEAGYANKSVDEPLRSVVIASPLNVDAKTSPEQWLAKELSGAWQAALPADSMEFAEAAVEQADGLEMKEKK